MTKRATVTKSTENSSEPKIKRLRRKPPPTRDRTTQRDAIRRASRFAYDLQALRIATGNRSSEGVETSPLDEEEKTFLAASMEGLHALEKSAVKEVARQLQGYPVYESWLKHQRGVGPSLAGVLVSGFNVTKAQYPSSFWKYAGLHVVQNAAGAYVAPKLKAGEKGGFNTKLRAKLLKVLGDCLLKAKNEKYGGVYYDYKHRLQSMRLEKCVTCSGTGRASPVAGRDNGENETAQRAVVLERTQTASEPLSVSAPAIDSEPTKKKVKCWNCEGTGGPAPWGKSDAHRHQAAIRYMIKQFVADFWRAWREADGLPVTSTYAEGKLGLKHRAGER